MRRAPVLAPFAWVLATAIAIGVSWLGVGAVTRAVTAAPEPVIPAARIAAQHPSLAPLPLPNGKLVVAAPAPRATSTTTAPTTVAREPTPTIVVPATVVPASGSTTTTTTTTTQPASPGTGETNPPPPPPPPVPETFTAAGGEVSVTDICTGVKIVVDDVHVSDGYQETTEIPGPALMVEVSFSKSKTTYVIEAQCSNGTPVKVPPVGWGVGPGSGSGPNPGQF
jgi:hypothetical protein